jgi:hypothetical protein
VEGVQTSGSPGAVWETTHQGETKREVVLEKFAWTGF